jgi:hypothetical protein
MKRPTTPLARETEKVPNASVTQGVALGASGEGDAATRFEGESGETFDPRESNTSKDREA